MRRVAADADEQGRVLEGPMFEQIYDEIGEREMPAFTAVAEGAESLLNELSGAFEDPILPEQPVETAPAAVEEEPPVPSPPRLEPPVMVWKPQRRARFRLRRR